MSTQHPDPRLSACISALRACRETFAHYTEHHLAKGNAEKAKSNARMAGICDGALAKALDGAENAGDVYRLTSDRTAAVSTQSTFLSMDSCPISRKVILLGAGGVATVGQYDGREPFWQGWHPLPRRAK